MTLGSVRLLGGGPHGMWTDSGIETSDYGAFCSAKGRHNNSLPLTTNFSQNVTEPSKGVSYPVGDLF